MNSPLDANELKAVLDTPDFLVRSRHEMMRLLNAMRDADVALSISFMNSEDLTESTLIDVDEPGNRLLLECPPGWRDMLGHHASGDSIMLTGALDGAKIQFQCGTGEVIEVDDSRVLSLTIPEFMWRFQRRRDSRVKMPALKITLNLGMGGIGALHCDSALQLQTGEVLSGCAIALPGVGQIAVDLTVRHLTPLRLPDGRDVTRVGCQFTQLDDHARQLIAHCLETLAEQ